jgi:hypothetical protein
MMLNLTHSLSRTRLGHHGATGTNTGTGYGAGFNGHHHDGGSGNATVFLRVSS